MPTVIQSQIVVPFGNVDVARQEYRALTLEDATHVFPCVGRSFGRAGAAEAAYRICETLRSRCELRGSHEHLFLLLYFDRVIEMLQSGETLRTGLLPLPNAQFTLPGADSITADFAFWTGRRFIAVFIRESRFDQDHFERERLLKLWGVEVIPFMADQLETRGLKGETGAQIWQALGL